jgi:hypothetical protein
MKSAAINFKEMTDAGVLAQHMTVHKNFDETDPSDTNLREEMKAQHDGLSAEMFRRGYTHQTIGELDGNIAKKEVVTPPASNAAPDPTPDPPAEQSPRLQLWANDQKESQPLDEWDDKAKESLDDIVYAIRRNAESALAPDPPPPVEYEPYPWVREVWEGFVIVAFGDTSYKITYTESDDGYEFASRDDWIEVEWTWQPVGTEKELTDLPSPQICGSIPQVSGGAEGKISGATEEKPKRRLMDQLFSALRNSVKGLLTEKDQGKSAAFSGETVLSSFKDSDDNWRWLAITSTAVQDREGEIVSRQAIDKGIERAKELGSAGDLRFWHTDISLGTCDFQARDDLCLIESGVWHDDAVSKAARQHVAENPDDWRLSIRFLYPSTSVTKEAGLNIHNDMAFVERSVLPTGREAALFTHLNPGGNVMRKDQEVALRTLTSDDLVDKILGVSADVSEKAEAAGLATKELDQAKQVEKALASIDDEETRKILADAIETQKGEGDGEPCTEPCEPTAEPVAEPEKKEPEAPEPPVEPTEPEDPMPEKAAENQQLANLLAEAIAPLGKRIESIEASVKELQETPRHSNPLYRASASKESALSSEEKVEGPGGTPDVIDDIVANVFGPMREAQVQ